jgi:metal-responsive CopG/Arc/MetJ family transcriptional regulator
MARTTKVLGFSVPPKLAREVEAMARRERTTKSELFRRMVQIYKEQQEESEFFRLQARMAQRARRRGFSEDDVERIVFEDR